MAQAGSSECRQLSCSCGWRGTHVRASNLRPRASTHTPRRLVAPSTSATRRRGAPRAASRTRGARHPRADARSRSAAVPASARQRPASGHSQGGLLRPSATPRAQGTRRNCEEHRSERERSRAGGGALSVPPTRSPISTETSQRRRSSCLRCSRPPAPGTRVLRVRTSCESPPPYPAELAPTRKPSGSRQHEHQIAGTMCLHHSQILPRLDQAKRR